MSAQRIIALIQGDPGVGKSFLLACIAKKALIYDTDPGGGLSPYQARIERNGSERIEINSYPELLEDLNRRKSQGLLKDRVTIGIDHLSTLHQESCLRNNPRDERDFGTSSTIATREWRRVRNFAARQDFNLICIAHMKPNWQDQKQIGMTADAAKNLAGDFHVSLHVRRSSGYPGVAWVEKWIRDPEDPRGLVPSAFPFTAENFEKYAGTGLLDLREPVPQATDEQCRQLAQLMDVAKLPEGTAEKWLKKAGVDSFVEMSAPDVQKCIAFVQGLLNDAQGKTSPTPLKKGK